MIKCFKCNKNDAQMHPTYGPTWCVECTNKSNSQPRLGKPFEFTTDEIREGRKKYAKELLQPYRQGEFSKEYKEAYPQQAKSMVKEGVITQKQYKNAKNVWGRDRFI